MSIFDKNNSFNNKETVRTVEEDIKTIKTDYTDFNQVVVDNIKPKKSGWNKSIYLTPEAHMILNKFCLENDVKASHVVDTLIKQFLNE